jgi:hypothetical protein
MTQYAKIPHFVSALAHLVGFDLAKSTFFAPEEALNSGSLDATKPLRELVESYRPRASEGPPTVEFEEAGRGGHAGEEGPGDNPPR